MKEFTPEDLNALAAFVSPERFSTGQSNRELHLKDISHHQGSLPAGIIWPASSRSAASVVRRGSNTRAYLP